MNTIFYYLKLCIYLSHFAENIFMNQILISKYNGKNQFNIVDEQIIDNSNIKYKRNNRKIIFIILLSISIIVLFSSFIYMSYSFYIDYTKSNMYNNLYSNYDISKLYTNNMVTQNSISLENDIFSIIGIIKIDKIKISYPILSKIDDELLKIAPCRFSGPNTNEVGNLCIAAHNYNDNRFFGNLSKLNINDEIELYSKDGKMQKYVVYDKYETNINDISCTLPSSPNIKEITLLTCNNLTGGRIIVKAKSVI